MIEIEEMKYHMPGWSADVNLGGNRQALFQLWAPSEKRSDWLAAWTSFEVDDPDDDHAHVLEGSDRGEARHGETMDEALQVLDSFPGSDLAARVRRLLSGAAHAYEATTEPNGDN